MRYENKKVIVALSGGVDSAVAAALLKKQGYDVSGAYIHFFDGLKDVKAAKRAKNIAKKLGMKFFEIDARKDFRKKIIDNFIRAHESGLTPNPCVICNKEIKFAALFDLMKKQKADYIATGHYALIKVRPSVQGSTFPLADKSANSSRSNLRGIPQGRTLCEAKDKTKDQSYFLYRLTQKDLAKIIFPLGEYKKTEVKKIAEKLRLPVANEESQDVCFVDRSINDFLRKRIKLKPGEIVGEKGNILGRHKGLPLYTLGQRKGIEIGSGGPYFVVGKNLRKNGLVVTSDPKKLLTKKFLINKANWTGEAIRTQMQAKVQIRYHSDKIPAIIKKEKKGRYSVETAKPLRAPAPGQSAVFYQGNEVLGGGIITS